MLEEVLADVLLETLIDKLNESDRLGLSDALTELDVLTLDEYDELVDVLCETDVLLLVEMDVSMRAKLASYRTLPFHRRFTLTSEEP